MKKIKITLIIMTILMATGCSSKPPKQTQPYGNLTPIFENQTELNERD